MAQRTWFITGVSSGFGRQLTEQLLERGIASSAPSAIQGRSQMCVSAIPRPTTPRCSTSPIQRRFTRCSSARFLSVDASTC